MNLQRLPRKLIHIAAAREAHNMAALLFYLHGELKSVDVCLFTKTCLCKKTVVKKYMREGENSATNSCRQNMRSHGGYLLDKHYFYTLYVAENAT